MHKTLILLAALASSLPAAAQKPDVKSGAIVASEPGKAAAVRAVELTAQVVAIDKTSRTVTLKGPKGNVVEVVAGDDLDHVALRALERHGPRGLVDRDHLRRELHRAHSGRLAGLAGDDGAAFDIRLLSGGGEGGG